MLLCSSGVSYGADVGTTTNSDEISFDIGYDVTIVTTDIVNDFSFDIVSNTYTDNPLSFSSYAILNNYKDDASISYSYVIQDKTYCSDLNSLIATTTPEIKNHRARHVGKLITTFFISNLETKIDKNSHKPIGKNVINPYPKQE